MVLPDGCAHLGGGDGPSFVWFLPFHPPTTEVTSVSRDVVYMYTAKGELSCTIPDGGEGHATPRRKENTKGSKGAPADFDYDYKETINLDFFDQDVDQDTSQLRGDLSPGVASALGSAASTPLEQSGGLRPEHTRIPPPGGKGRTATHTLASTRARWGRPNLPISNMKQGPREPLGYDVEMRENGAQRKRGFSCRLASRQFSVVSKREP